MKRKTIISLVLMLALAACAQAIPVQPVQMYNVPGFFSGLLHGLILPIALVGSIFSDNVAIYSVVNSGFGYDLGFCIGTMIVVRISISSG